MLRPKIHSLPTGLNVESTFDIFKRLPDGNFTCIAAVRGLREAARRINRLAKQNTAHYLIHSQGLVFWIPTLIAHKYLGFEGGAPKEKSMPEMEIGKLGVVPVSKAADSEVVNPQVQNLTESEDLLRKSTPGRPPARAFRC
jgi:hypothetical protein